MADPRMAKRIMNEQKSFEKERSEIEEIGIYVKWDQNDVSKAKALIMGPPDTPYEYGFYLFEIDFPQDYPMNPPKVQFRTTDHRARLHPNLYVEGKVCLSILGTWPGDKWVSTYRLKTVLIQIQSLLHNHPITCEPAYENKEGKKEDLEYNTIVSYESTNVAVHFVLKNLPAKFKEFQPIMEKKFIENYTKITEKLDKEHKSREGKSMRAPCFSYQCNFKVKELQKNLAALHDKVNPKGAKKSPRKASPKAGPSSSSNKKRAGSPKSDTPTAKKAKK